MLAPTPSQTVGPFFSFGLCARPTAEVVPPDTAGTVELGGHVLDGAGKGVPDAMVEIWQAVADGHRFGRCGTDRDGSFRFVVAKPVGELGEDVGRRAPHLTVLVFARGLLKPVLTRMYFPGETGNDADPLLSALPEDDRAALVAEPVDGGLLFDIRLQGERQTPFFAL
jgi:protocatechuate 3,4-dioxygenase alpha subunit